MRICWCTDRLKIKPSADKIKSIMAEEKKIPSWIRKIGLAGIYEKIAIERIPQKFFKAKFFRKRIDIYNTKKDE